MNTPSLSQPRAAARLISAPQGELDLATAGELRTILANVVSSGAAQVVLDLSNVSFMDASALGVIVAAANRLRLGGGRLTLAGAAPNIERVLRLTGLHEFLLPVAAP